MAKEAKVGLLLGLVFIVAIAIVLRGVHENSQPQLEESLGLSEASEPLEMESLTLAVEKLTPVQPQPIQNQPLVNTPSVQPGIVTQLPQPQTAPSGLTAQPAPEQSMRYVQDLPQRPQQHPASDVAPSQPEQVVTTITPPAQSTSENLEAALDRITTNVTGPTTVVVPPVKATRPRASIYVVQQGDDLSGIALKVYGSEQGKRWVNVQKIYQANRNILPSADMVREGQRLKIPALSQSTTTKNLEKIEKPKQPVKPQTPKKQDKIYVVQDGDSLWKIAEKQLGNGTRYSEIVELNTKTLRDENNLFVGMRLSLPDN